MPRVLLKLSGEALANAGASAICPIALHNLAQTIVAAQAAGVEIGIVVGGGNVLRGGAFSADNIARHTADQMGMMATMINALAVRDALQHLGVPVYACSSVALSGVLERADIHDVRTRLSHGEVVVFGGGTGNPFVTTDSAASLRAVEIGAEVVLKASTVDGIYNADPKKDPTATRYDSLTFDEALKKELAIMDLAAFCQCKEYDIKIRVFDYAKPGALLRALTGEPEGTLVHT
jgi:uridylate kinase